MSKDRCNRKILFEGKYLRLIQEGGWEYVERVRTTGIVIIVGVTANARVIFIDQFRKPVGNRVVEFPAGLVNDLRQEGDEEETLEAAARREFWEETGYEAEKMELILSGPASAGSSPHLVTFFRARNLRKTGPGGGDATEDIHVHEVPLDEVPRWLKEEEHKGLLIDPKVYAGLYFLRK